MKKRGELVFGDLVYWIIAIVLLAIVLILYFILSGKGQSALEYLKNLWRFGR